ncbi:MAG: hypothetical protein JXA30_13395 [Deltaproteobacteria bacterium]|nr:hypothetical protein [Deltaproteobacteria bacterium]
MSLAQSYLNGQLSVVDNRPLGTNDWARYQGRWYVSFPPFPAIVILPAVALFGPQIWDRLFWAIFAGLGPAFLYLVLRYLRESARSERKLSDDLLLTFLFAFGTVYFFSSVQGTTWYAAHIVCCALLPLFVLWSFNARRPLLAGTALAFSFLTRPNTVLVALFFLVEAVNGSTRERLGQCDGDQPPTTGLRAWISGVDYARVLRRVTVFSLPIIAAVAVMLWMNNSRFDDPLVFGHEYLEIKWRYRIDKWSLFNYHYLSKNLAILLAALPWLSNDPPFIKISQHGLALWFTTPHLLLILWPKRVTPTMVGLYLSAALVALVDLCYQNSGWIQFGYRFSLDYMVLLFALLALGQRRFRLGFYSLVVFALAVNLFGAITFDRVKQFYDTDLTQTVIFQPD